MKIKFTVFTLALITLVFIFSACSKHLEGKDRVIALNKKMIEYINSDQFGKDIRANMDQQDQNIDKGLEDKMMSLAKDFGYKDKADIDTEFKKFANDPDVNKVQQEMMTLLMQKMQPYMQEMIKKLNTDSTSQKSDGKITNSQNASPAK
jgi:hypothetical protein